MLAATGETALAAIRSLLEAQAATLTRSDASGAILDLALSATSVGLDDVYEIAGGPSLGAFADQTKGVDVLGESVTIDLPHGAWIRVSRAGTSGTVESTLDADADDGMDDEDPESEDAASDEDPDADRPDEDADEDADEDDLEEARLAREDALRYSAAVAALESLVLAQYCAGIDVTTPQYRDALVTSWDSLLNRYT